MHWIKYCLLLLVLTACQQNSTIDSTTRFLFTEEKKARIDSLFQSAIEQKKIPGAVALIAEAEQIRHHKAWGNSNIENGQRQDTSDLFRIASMTKPITAVAAMMLFEEGKFQLDDPLSKHIPAFANPQILDKIDLEDSTFTAHPAQSEITIQQLFTHSSGIGYGFQDEQLMAVFEKAGITEGFEERDILLKDNVERIARMPLLHEPGEQFTYGLNSDILGYLVELWSHMPLDSFFQQRIFSPLGMQDTHFYLPEQKAPRLTSVYMSSDTGIVPTDYPLIHYPTRGAKRYLSGGADLSCTAHDYYLFSKMLLQGGILNGKRILTPKTIELMTRSHLESGEEDMGLGFGIMSSKSATTTRARSLGSYSWGGFFATTFWIDPEEELIAILLLQVYPFENWKIMEEFEKLIYEIE
ncbi:MAG: beta-lactamase family protein [Saprospiraceae bacterium]|nr:beta-lactamase family protein [Saprospiraceae bacterium]